MKSTGVSNTLDVRFYYTFEEAVTFFISLSDETGFRYLVKELLDLVYICLYSGLFKRGIRHFIFPNYPKLFISLIPGLLDVIETLSIIFVLIGFASFDVLTILGFVTCLKWSSALLIISLIIFGWVRSKRA